MKPLKVFQLNKEGKVSFTEEELLDLLKEVYWEGYTNNFNHEEMISNQPSLLYVTFLDYEEESLPLNYPKEKMF